MSWFQSQRNHQQGQEIDDIVLPSLVSAEAPQSGCFCNPFAPSEIQENQSIEEVERIISEGLMGISLKEREEAIQEVHGVVEQNKEDQDILSSCYNEIEFYLSQRKESSKALQLALDYNEGSYVRSLYLKFLRCDGFNAEKAANRLVKHFELKRELFGNGCLGRDVILNDLDKDDMQCLKVGAYQLLPCRDCAGRAVFACCFYAQEYKKPINLVGPSHQFNLCFDFTILAYLINHFLHGLL